MKCLQTKTELNLQYRCESNTPYVSSLENAFLVLRFSNSAFDRNLCIVRQRIKSMADFVPR